MGLFKTLTGKLFAYNDGNYDRAAMGNLDAYTGPDGVVSPAQAGFRAINQDGNAIFDSMGLIDTMRSLGFAAAGTSDSVATANSSTWADFGLDTQFTVQVPNRPVRFIYLLTVAAKTTGAAGQVAYVRGNISGFDTSASVIFDKNNTGWTNAFIWYFAGPSAPQTKLPV